MKISASRVVGWLQFAATFAVTQLVWSTTGFWVYAWQFWALYVPLALLTVTLLERLRRELEDREYLQYLQAT